MISKQNLSIFFTQYFNMAILTLLGRVLIVAALVSSAYLHIYQSHLSTKEFSSNYSVLDSLSQQFLQFDLPWDNANWSIAVRIFGLFEALVVLLIIIGDSLGGTLYAVSVFGQIFFLLWPKIESDRLLKWNYAQISEASHLISLFGMGLILACSAYNKSKK